MLSYSKTKNKKPSNAAVKILKKPATSAGMNGLSPTGTQNGTPDSRDTDDTIYFQTAWSNVSDLIKKLSGFFSSTFFYEWADEDIGSNAGRAVARGGNLVINRAQGRKAYELAFDLNPGLKDQFEYVGGKYEFIV